MVIGFAIIIAEVIIAVIAVVIIKVKRSFLIIVANLGLKPMSYWLN